MVIRLAENVRRSGLQTGVIMYVHKIPKLILLLFMLYFLFIGIASGQPPCHDPAHMVKDGGRYRIYTTGDGINNMSASDADFTDWRSESRVFPRGTWPAWINSYVPDFAGAFWAPEILYMNGKWHLYYSCSTWGSPISAIGLVTSRSLSTPNWEDQGMVVRSNSSSDHNAIDPDIFRDDNGKVWFLYGSWWDGIVITELDSTSGKPIDPLELYHAANNQCEAGNVILHGNYYYVFFNRGSCASGVHSTYHILVGRSTSPTGPFYDKDSIATNSNGGTLFLHSDGRYVGPGHFGYGEDKLTYHFYDGESNGVSRLKIAGLEWENDWPVAVYTGGGDLEGTCIFSNVTSRKVLEIENGDTMSGTNVAQYTETGDSCQRWEVTYLDGGYYKISPVLASDKALEVEGGSTSNGANVQIGKYKGEEYQQWYAAYMGSGIYRIMARHSLIALEIASSSTAEGANAIQRTYDEGNNQRWAVEVSTIISSIGSTFNKQEEINLFPNPTDGRFTIELIRLTGSRTVHLEVYTIDGKRVYSKIYKNTNTIAFQDFIDSGVFIIKITTEKSVMTQKLFVK